MHVPRLAGMTMIGEASLTCSHLWFYVMRLHTSSLSPRAAPSAWCGRIRYWQETICNCRVKAADVQTSHNALAYPTHFLVSVHRRWPMLSTDVLR